MLTMLAELYVLSGRDAGKLIDAVGPTLFMGRAATNHYRIRDAQASRVHCRIDITTNSLTLSDTNSGNGTYLNETKVEGRCTLCDGDEIRVGATRLKVLIETANDRLAEESREVSLREEKGSAVSGLADSASVSLAVSHAQPDDLAEPEQAEQDELGPEEFVPPSDERKIAAASESKPKKKARSGSDGPKRKLRDVLPGFRLQRRLAGHSHKGIAVYRAQQLSLERTVALKVFLPRGGHQPVDVDRFLREAKSIARLPHPNVVTVHDVLSRGKMRVIVTEYLAGGSLADRLDSGRALGLDVILDVGEGIARALGYLHTQGIAHRNVKPTNILLSRELRTYKLAGFGYATGPSVQAQGDTCFLEGNVEGFAFLSPEQLGEDLSSVGPASDVYSLGATLYACAAARLPFEGESPMVVAANILRDPAPELEGLNDALATIIGRCMEKDPDDRYPDGNALLHELGACRAALSGLGPL